MINNFIGSEALFAQLPGYIGLFDLNFNVQGTNLNAAKLLGFSSPDKMIGLTDYDINCDAIKCADEFRKQNIKVLNTQKEMQVLGMLTYADMNLHSVVGTKKPIYNANNELEGLIIAWQDINSKHFDQLYKKIIQHDQFFLSKKPSYINKTIQDNFDIAELTNSESEILYHYMRGLSAREIGIVFSRSQRTIEFHIDNIKNKLGLQRKSEIIAFCIEHGLLNIIPKSFLSNSVNFIFEINN